MASATKGRKSAHQEGVIRATKQRVRSLRAWGGYTALPPRPGPAAWRRRRGPPSALRRSRCCPAGEGEKGVPRGAACAKRQERGDPRVRPSPCLWMGGLLLPFSGAPPSQGLRTDGAQSRGSQTEKPPAENLTPSLQVRSEPQGLFPKMKFFFYLFLFLLFL